MKDSDAKRQTEKSRQIVIYAFFIPFHFKIIQVGVFFLALTFLAGCAQLHPQSTHTPRPQRSSQPARPQEPRERMFKLVIESDPSGAEVLWPVRDGSQSIGHTPLHFRMRFIEDETPLRDRLRGQRVWVPDPDDPFTRYITKVDNGFRFQTPTLTFQHDNYHPETRAFSFRLGQHLFQDSDAYRRAASRTETIVMRVPTQPQIQKRIIIDTVPSGAMLHSITEEGDLGPKIGTTPFLSVLQFAAIRDRQGNIVRWRRWAKEDRVLWNRVQHDLLFSGVFLHANYQPEVIQSHPVATLTSQTNTDTTARFVLSRPAQPRNRFTLQVDSLPTGADVYQLQADNTLGDHIGHTPFEIEIGFAQQVRLENDQLVHDDWLVWGPTDLLDWESQEDGTTEVYLACALYKEGYALEQPTAPVVVLQPGSRVPRSRVLNIPLLRPEQAAVREARQTMPQQAPVTQSSAPAPTEEERRMFIWQAPEDIPGRGEEEVITIEDERTPSLFGRLRNRLKNRP